MSGFIFAIISGISMTLQGVFNTRLSEKIGEWQTNIFVQGTGLIFALIALFFFGGGNFKNIKAVNKLYLSGGILGVIIIYTVMISIVHLKPTVAISTILIAQLLSAALIESFGFFNTKKANFSISEVVGVLLMTSGIVVFKFLRF